MTSWYQLTFINNVDYVKCLECNFYFKWICIIIHIKLLFERKHPHISNIPFLINCWIMMLYRSHICGPSLKTPNKCICSVSIPKFKVYESSTHSLVLIYLEAPANTCAYKATIDRFWLQGNHRWILIIGQPWMNFNYRTTMEGLQEISSQLRSMADKHSLAGESPWMSS